MGYEVYIRSFADASGDGIGDLDGITAHLDDLAWLGVGIVWITPFYPSPQADHGYDVADYLGVDPTYGDLAAFQRLVEAAHARDIKVVVDLVPNHTSSRHPWFVASRSSRDDPKRDWYLWRDSAPDGGPPNNWLSHFGGPAWTFDEATGQWWCHLFLPEQPDLNWRHEGVRRAFDEILATWLDRGVDGFRVDVAHSLTKHPEFPDLPPAPEDHVRWMNKGAFEDVLHLYDMDQPDNLDVHRRFRKTTGPRGAVLIGETYVSEAVRLRRYLDPPTGMDLHFWFAPLHISWTPAEVRRVVQEGATLPLDSIAWVTGSHDRPRAASRFGGGDLGRRRALGLAALQMGLPGTPFVYQGEELALEDARLEWGELADPSALRNPEEEIVPRDVARTPYPWAPVAGRGFTTASSTWLPFGGYRDEETFAAQLRDERSWLHAWRRLLHTRRRLVGGLPPLVSWTSRDPLVGYERDDLCVVLNAGDEPVSLEGPGEVVWHRDPAVAGAADGISLGAGDAVWIV